jgi:hypothetical protein
VGSGVEKLSKNFFIRKVSWLFFDSPALLPVVVSAFFICWLSGLSAVPNIGAWVRFARYFPHHPPFTATYPYSHYLQDQYLQSSPIGIAAGHYLRATSIVAYARLEAVVVALDFLLLIVGLYRRLGRFGIGLATALFWILPVSHVLVTQLGMEDPYTVFFFTLLVLFDSPVFAAVAGIGLAASHLEVAVFGVAAWAVVEVVAGNGRNCKAKFVGVVSGLVVGIGLVAAIQQSAGGSFTARVSWATGGHSTTTSHMIHDLFSQFPYWLFSIFCTTWILLIAGLSVIRRADKRLFLSIVAVLVLGIGITSVTLDETRIYVLLTFPVVLWMIRTVPTWNIEHKQIQALVSLAVIISIYLPHVLIWEGRCYIYYGRVSNIKVF